MTDYEKLFKQDHDVCGPPFPEILEFFAGLEILGARVLDLGCGQGRDALPIARSGHTVIGVDLSPTGVAQMMRQAESEGLAVEGHVADIREFVSEGLFDVVLMDRILHMLEDDSDRELVLTKACQVTTPQGYVLVVDTPKNMSIIRQHFDRLSHDWIVVQDGKNLLFAKKEAAQHL